VTLSDQFQHRSAVFIRVRRIFAAPTCTRAIAPDSVRCGQGCEGYDTNHDTNLLI
jgi:hypothetical protein